VFENTEIAVVEKDGEDFLVSATDGRQFRAPALLITAGAWGTQLSSQFGEPVPQEVHGPQMGVTEPPPYRIRPVLGVSSPITEEIVYLRQIPRGNVIFGGGNRGPAYPDLRRSYVLPANTMNQLPQLRRLVPALANVNIIRVWSGIEAYLPDDRPVMGPSSRVPGLFYAFGFCGHGFQLGPGVGDTEAAGAGADPSKHRWKGRALMAFRPPLPKSLAVFGLKDPPAATDIRSAELDALMRRAGEAHSDTVVIMKDGQIVVEEYFGREREPIELRFRQVSRQNARKRQ
jgi:glycine/D-amino acid oxidase-like deaminating enzyme